MTEVAAHAGESLPAWSLPKDAVERISLPGQWPDRVTREWAWGSSTGAGARVCILDSGVEANHPLVTVVDTMDGAARRAAELAAA